jgi:diguanylate cyclase (GGDEF)-like protein/PAS domain S-box-containing protein
MLEFLQKYSFSKKILLLVAMTISMTFFIGLLLSTAHDIDNIRSSANAQIKMLAKVLAKNSASALVFNDEAAAADTLSVVDGNEMIRRVEIENAQHVVFTSHNNSHPQLDSIFNHFPIINNLVIEQPIELNGRVEGKIRIFATLSAEWRLLVGKWVLDTLILGLVLLFGLAFLKRQLRIVLVPISRLARATREIIRYQRYSMRVENGNEDEFGELTKGFNQMLTQIELTNSKLRQSSEALAQTQEAIALRDENLCCLYVNPAFTQLFGYELEEVIGKPISLQAKNSGENELTQKEIYEIARDNGSYRGEVIRCTKDGRMIPISLNISPMRDEKGMLTGYISVSQDISEKKQAQEWIWRQANFDLLTGLPNRHMFYDRVEQEILRTRRTGAPFVLMFLDLDNFKEVNDTLGHDMGDMLLKSAAERLISCVRGSDTVGIENNVARLGGDEFMVILNNFQSLHNVDQVAQRILTKLGEPYHLGAEVALVSASIGITVCPDDAIDTETLIRNADQTMYHAKNKGRNTFCYFTRNMHETAQRRRKMIIDLREAVEEKQFVLAYQPIIDLTTGRVHKAEALIRWQHPKQGLISPMDFIPLAEETGLIIEIGNWLFYQVTNQLVKWRESIHPDFQISINKSPAQFYNKGNDHNAWFDHLHRLGLPGDSLVIEITEGLMLDKNLDVSQKLLAFRDAGVQVAVDDFGTGYSSLSYLKKFDIDYIKIDKSFVQNLAIHSDDIVLCEAIIVMSHKLGLKVVAEGIETDQQRDLLFGIGCDYGQGYLFSRPVSAEKLEAFCIEQNRISTEQLDLELASNY